MQPYIDKPQYITQIRHLIERPWPAADIGRTRMERVFTHSPVDVLPLIFWGPTPEKQTFPTFNRQELFYDVDKMACEQFWWALSFVRSESDALPMIRPNTGAATTATLFGLQQEILPNDPPWLQQHLTKQQISNFRLPDDIRSLGLMPFVKTIIAFYRTHLPMLPIYVADTQGPFDLAHRVYGDAIFTELYDDPPFMKHLMDLVTDAYIRVTDYLKSLTGEPIDRCYHSSFYMPTGGVRICEDTSTLLSPELIDEFVVPYTNRILEHFGGGWIHYCGQNDYLQNTILTQMPKCRALNLGNPEKHDMSAVIRNVKKAGKVYYGSPAREHNQSLEDYFRYTLGLLNGERRGLILFADIRPDEASQPKRVVDLYHRLQDELLS